MGEKNCVVKMQVDYGNGEKLDAVFRSVPEDTPAEVIKLINRRRTGDLIPRDEITPQMAAEVLLSGPSLLARAMAETMNGGMWSTPSHYNGDQRDVWESYAIAALTAIKESKDD